MESLFLALAVLLSLLLIMGWVMLIVALFSGLSAAAVGGFVTVVGAMRGFRPARARDIGRGILCLEGLAKARLRAARLRTDLARVLRNAPPETNPRACVCVKDKGDRSIGVLRVFNTQGHYLLRASGENPAAVARSFSETLHEFNGNFPALPGVRRAECPECDRSTCPLHMQKRERFLSVAAA